MNINSKGLYRFGAALLTLMMLAVTCIIPNTAVVVKAASTYYVATNGNDTTGTGTLANPWQTIQKAASTMTAGDTCMIRAGTYRETVTPTNSGTAGNPIKFQNYNGESVTISGTEQVSNTGWTLDSGNIYKSNLTAIRGGFTSLGDENQVFIVSGSTVTRCWEARWPNISDYTFSGLTAASATKTADSGTATTITDADLTQADDYWKNGVVWCRGGSAWTSQTGKISGFNASTDTLTFDAFAGDGYLSPTAGNIYYITGVKAALDADKEWFIDSSTGIIYLRAPGGGIPSNVEVKKRVKGFDLSNRNYITILGVNIFAANICMNNSNNCIVDGVAANYVYFNRSTWAYWASSQMDNGINITGDNNEIRNSTIAYSTGTLIKLSGSNNKIMNNDIHDADYLGSYAAAIHLFTGNNNLISNNTISNAGRSVIHWEAGFSCQALIQYNEIKDFLWICRDGGAFNSWGMDLGNSQIRYNIIHGNKSGVTGDWPPCAGIYLDNYSQNAVVDHNVFYDSYYGIFLNTPSNQNLVYNNTFDCTIGIGSPSGEMYGDRVFNNLSIGSVNYSSDCEGGNNLTATSGYFTDYANRNYHLAAGSSAINAGVAIYGITDGYVTAPDCGAYEYGGTDWTAGHNFSSSPNPSYTTPNVYYKNLLANPAFELSTNNWTKTGAALATTVAYTDRGACSKLQLGGGVDGVEQTITGLTPNTAYKLTGWLYAGSGETVRLGVKNFGGSDTYSDVTSTSYVRKTIYFTTGSSNTSATIYINKTSAGSGYAYADDLAVVCPFPDECYKGAWYFNSNGNDASGNGYNLTANGSPTYSTADKKEGTASVSLNGSTQYFNRAAPATTATDNITMSAWVNWGGSTGSNQIILYNGSSNGYGLMLNAGDSNKLVILCENVAIMSSATTLTQGAWTHLAAVRRSGTWELYVNGSSVSLDSNTAAPITPSGSFIIGANSVGFKGKIDEVKIFDKALLPVQISNEAAMTDDYKAAWYFNGNGNDSSGNGYNLTANGSPTYNTADKKEGTASVSLNGSTQYFNRAAPATTATDNITMSAWVNWGGSTGSNEIILYNGSSNGYGLMLNAGDSNKLVILCENVAIMSSATILTQGVWTHLAAVRRSGTWELYVNGSSVSLNSNTATPITPTGSFIIGANSLGFKGMIDGVKVFERALTQSQIIGLQN